jgi:hypothetical protein
MIRLRCMPTQPEVRHLHNLLQSHWLLCALLCERVQISTASYTKAIDLNDGYTIETKAKGNRQKANLRVYWLTYLAYFRLLHPPLLSGDKRGEIMRLRSGGGQSPADIHTYGSTSDRILCSGIHRHCSRQLALSFL